MVSNPAGYVNHVVLIRVSPDASESQIEALREGIHSYRSLIPGIVAVHFGEICALQTDSSSESPQSTGAAAVTSALTPLQVPAGSEPAAVDGNRSLGFTHCIGVVFESWAALRAFGPHPDHQRIKQAVVDPIVCEKVVVDAVDLSAAPSLPTQVMPAQDIKESAVFPLNDGSVIPCLGFGTWGDADPPELIAEATRHALEAGFVSFDFAEKYGNESHIGAILKTADVPRENLYLASKVWNTNHDPEHVRQSLLRSLSNLGTSYLDLYMVHWPVAFAHTDLGTQGGFPRDEHGSIALAAVPIQQTWKAMEELVTAGLVRSIGVANFSVAQLADLLTYANIKPAVNQVELHPYLSQVGLRDFCRHVDIQLVAYSPLGRPGQTSGEPPVIEDPVIVRIASERGCTSAQVLLAWHRQHGVVAIPKSSNPKRIRENLESLEITLSDAHMAEIDRLNKNLRYCNMRLAASDPRAVGPPFRVWGPTLFE